MTTVAVKKKNWKNSGLNGNLEGIFFQLLLKLITSLQRSSSCLKENIQIKLAVIVVCNVATFTFT